MIITKCLVLIFLMTLQILYAQNPPQIKLILLSMAQDLQQFSEDQSIFDQVQHHITHHSIQHQNYDCQVEYGYLGDLLELDSKQLQFLTIMNICDVQLDYMLNLEGFTHSDLNLTGFYIRQNGNVMQLFAFKSHFDKSFLWHQCEFDGYSQQCIKGNQDHINQLGRNCQSKFIDIFADCNDSDRNAILWSKLQSIFPNVAYLILYIFYFILNHEIKDNKQAQKINTYLYLFLLILPFSFNYLNSLFILYSLSQIKFKSHVYFRTLQIIGSLTCLQLIFINIDLNFNEEYAYVLIISFIIIQLSQVIITFIDQTVGILFLVYLIEQYLNIMKSTIEINTQLDEDNKIGMVYLMIGMGNQQQLYFKDVITMKLLVISTLLGINIQSLFPIFYLLIILAIGYFGYKFISAHQNIQEEKTLFRWILQQLAGFQISILFLSVAVVDIIIGQPRQYVKNSICNFLIFKIVFFYFPSDLVYVILGFSILYLYLRNFKDLETLIRDLKESFGKVMEGDFSWNDFLNCTKEVIKVMKN